MATRYNYRFPDRPPMTGNPDWLVGTWCIGACYKNPNSLYGAYPHGYLERVHSLFDDPRRILHAFSGGLRMQEAVELAGWGFMPASGRVMELVDVKGPEDGRYPTHQGDLLDYPVRGDHGGFELVLADPPYTPADAAKYGTMPVNRPATMRALREVTTKGGVLVWLDNQWPMHRKEHWRCFGHVGLVRSTNHKVRLVSFFEAV